MKWWTLKSSLSTEQIGDYDVRGWDSTLRNVVQKMEGLAVTLIVGPPNWLEGFRAQNIYLKKKNIRKSITLEKLDADNMCHCRIVVRNLMSLLIHIKTPCDACTKGWAWHYIPINTALICDWTPNVLSAGDRATTRSGFILLMNWHFLCRATDIYFSVKGSSRHSTPSWLLFPVQVRVHRLAVTGSQRHYWLTCPSPAWLQVSLT